MSGSVHLQEEMYRRMMRIRVFEDRAINLSKRGELSGALHTSTGQEATVVGACMALELTDYMVGTHRSHGHPIGKGGGLRGLMAELLGRVDGVNGGKGGSMHLADFSVGSLGETSIVGSGLPVAAGAALSAKLKGDGRVSLCFFGDGATSEGTFHEALNLAAIWRLPVIFVCENNGFAVTTPARQVVAGAEIARRAAGYGFSGEVVDGQDVLAVFRLVKEAVARARSGLGPTLIEARTYRYHEHAVGLPHLSYRSAEEIESWKKRDPIELFRTHLLAEKSLDAVELQKIDRDVAREVDEAVAFGLASPIPKPESAFEDVWAVP